MLLPRRMRRNRRRRWGLWPIGVGLLLAVIVWHLPLPPERRAAGETLHDEFAPLFEFDEVHAIEIRSSRERIDAAIRRVTAGEIFLFRALTSLRRGGRAGPESILNAPERMPILEVATRTSFLTLADAPGREIVVGTIVIRPSSFPSPENPTPAWYAGLDEPGLGLATMSFRIDEITPGLCRVTTETRIHTTDAASRRAFARYWRVIYPGSALIRRSWLAAIRRRAESPTPP
jgi:hypothetical protein